MMRQRFLPLASAGGKSTHWRSRMTCLGSMVRAMRVALQTIISSGRMKARSWPVKADRSVNLQAALRDWVGRVRLSGSARLQVDIDPYSFL